MAFGRLQRSHPSPPMSDINMTPLIDVMLVLLVIFMIAAPFVTTSLKLDLPRSAAAEPSDAPQVLVVALDAQGTLFISEQRVDASTLAARLAAAARHDPLTEVQLRADRAVPYGHVAEVLGWVQRAGLSRIGFVAHAEAAPAAAR